MKFGEAGFDGGYEKPLKDFPHHGKSVLFVVQFSKVARFL